MRENPETLTSLVLRTAGRLFLIGVVPIAVLASMAPWLFSSVFGQPWREAGVYVQLMSPMILAQFVVSPISQSAFVVERQDVQALVDGARFATVIAVFLLAHWVGLDSKGAVLLYSLSMASYYVLVMLIYQRLLAGVTKAAAGTPAEEEAGSR